MAQRRRYHAHLPGLIFVIASLFLGVGAFNSQNNLLFLFFGVAVASMIASGVVSGSMLMGLRGQRVSVSRAEVGGEGTIRYRIRNKNRFVPAFALSIEEDTPKGDDAWSGLLEPAGGFIAHIGASGEAIATVRARALRRGVGTMTRTIVTSRFPFGFMRKSVAFDQRTRVIVHPRVVPLRDDALRGVSSRSRGEVVSEHEKGTGGDFYALREYVPGDPITRIAWRASARHGDLLVREETRVGAMAFDIALHLGGTEEEDERAISLAASLAALAVRTGAPVSVSVPSCGVRTGRGASRRHLVSILDALAGVDRASLQDAHAMAPERGGALLAVHASGIDPSVAPSGAVHLSGADLDRLAIGGAP